MQTIMPNPKRWLAILSLGWLLFFTLTRSVLLHYSAADAELSAAALLQIYALGLYYDLAFLALAMLPFTLLIALAPTRYWQRPHGVSALIALTFLLLFILLFTGCAEFIFWQEFSVRFNFIAVDYLIYSDEVINNILESYPVYPLLALLALLAAGACTLVYHRSLTDAPTAQFSRAARTATLLVSAALCAVAVGLVDQRPRDHFHNSVQRELASNGPFQFFAAFRNNELDYRQFYASVNPTAAQARLQREYREPNAAPVRDIQASAQTARHNIILITVESLSAKYLGVFGNSEQLTPELDRLAGNSLLFRQLYATGTRTDRGLEAITLSLPPTPGRSVVKRIGRESGYASLGQQLRHAGYDSVFVYGGRGYFDNMNAFFSGNGYRVVDQSSVPNRELAFTNAWGMSDEDLYQQTLKLADADWQAKRPFFLQLMTTSNHRPYTYPAGRIDIPSGSGRKGAVKYTDYAIGQFIRQAQDKPWFDDTIFVIVADHTAGAAGRQDLPVDNYHIPMLIYAPKLIAAGEHWQLMSQIDIAPTLLGLLQLPYRSRFFGRDALAINETPARVLIGNYQHLGLYDGRQLTILSPRRQVRQRRISDQMGEDEAVELDDPAVLRAISYYQVADEALRDGRLQW